MWRAHVKRGLRDCRRIGTKDDCSRSTAAGFDERRGYVATANELSAITALSLAGLRRRVEAALFPRWAAS